MIWNKASDNSNSWSEAKHLESVKTMNMNCRDCRGYSGIGGKLPFDSCATTIIPCQFDWHSKISQYRALTTGTKVGESVLISIRLLLPCLLYMLTELRAAESDSPGIIKFILTKLVYFRIDCSSSVGIYYYLYSLLIRCLLFMVWWFLPPVSDVVLFVFLSMWLTALFQIIFFNKLTTTKKKQDDLHFVYLYRKGDYLASQDIQAVRPPWHISVCFTVRYRCEETWPAPQKAGHEHGLPTGSDVELTWQTALKV